MRAVCGFSGDDSKGSDYAYSWRRAYRRSFDDAIRHSISKISPLHFTGTEEYWERVIQLGELPLSVYNVGSLGVENTNVMKLS